jgi:alpha-L-fucosidase 2
MANIYARLGDGDRALECLDLMVRSCVGPNLFTYHNDWRGQGLTMYWGPGSQPPFQIDANLGLTAAVLEMLLFSKPGWVKLLPALPAKWPRGAFSGLLGRGGVEVGAEWDMPAGRLSATLQSPVDQTVDVQFPGELLALDCEPADAVASADAGAAEARRPRRARSIHLRAGRRVTLSARLDTEHKN